MSEGGLTPFMDVASDMEYVKRKFGDIPEQSIDLQEAAYYSDDTVIRTMFIPKGVLMAKHKHAYTHQSILISGRVRVHVEGYQPTEYSSAGTIIRIRAGVHHSVEALEDSEWFCIHAAKHKMDGELKGVEV
jgi:quercetin dioxygenase-like cupin family protein